MILEICKEYTFDAKHQLPYHNGKCKEDHGHTYRLIICLKGDIQDVHASNPESGMVVDFARLDDVVKPIVEEFLDHTDLSVFMSYPTAERLVVVLMDMFSTRIDALYGNKIVLSKVRLYEGLKAYVEWQRE
jgi:6-pyruvoyltetrahydropterin/6-carboxytetrahydropterin synthase